MKEFTLSCGGEKCCPRVVIGEGKYKGSIWLADDNDDMGINLNAEQAKQLRDILNRELPPNG
jgi:hypothetical protein